MLLCSVVKLCLGLPSVVCRSTVYQFRPLPVGWTPARDQALIRGSRPPPAWERRCCRSRSCSNCCCCTLLEEDQDQAGNSRPAWLSSFCTKGLRHLMWSADQVLSNWQTFNLLKHPKILQGVGDSLRSLYRHHFKSLFLKQVQSCQLMGVWFCK